LQTRGGMRATIASGIRLSVLTGGRIGEVPSAECTHFDLDGGFLSAPNLGRDARSYDLVCNCASKRPVDLVAPLCVRRLLRALRELERPGEVERIWLPTRQTPAKYALFTTVTGGHCNSLTRVVQMARLYAATGSSLKSQPYDGACLHGRRP
jgi:hypothetical protein